MNEQTLFDRFHDALDIEPRPGAYDRMRREFTTSPTVAIRRPVFPMRWTKMSFRVVAVVTVAVIAIGLITAFLAGHGKLVGTVPAARQDSNTVAYIGLMSSDYETMALSTSNACNTIQDTTCPAAVGRVRPTLTKWVADLTAFRTPLRYLTLDRALRNHLNEAVGDMDAAIAFQQRGDAAGFNLAMNALVYERAWIDPTVFSIEGTYPHVAGSYRDALLQTRQSLNACVNGSPAPNDLGCAHLNTGESCVGTLAQNCENDVQSVTTQLQTFMVGLAQNPPPASAETLVGHVERDLANADQAALAINSALLTGNEKTIDAEQRSLAGAIAAAYGDVSAYS